MNYVLGCALYVGTGALQPVIIDWLRLQDALGRHFLLLPTLANTAAMGACGLLAPWSEWQRLKVNRHRLLLTATIDLLSGMLLSGGLMLTGGSIFVVLYNSVPVWTVLQARLFLGKRPGLRQVIGVILVSVGLASNVFGSQIKLADNTSMRAIATGSAMALLGSFLHATMFILTEATLNAPSASPISSKVWCSLLGCSEACFMAVWVSMGTAIWGFRDTDSDPDPASHSYSASSTTFACGFISLFLVSTVHAASFFGLLQQVGAVGAALLKGLQTVVVVVVSAILFCANEDSQCLTPTKSLSLVLVLSGMMVYSSKRQSLKTKTVSRKLRNKSSIEPILS